MVTPHPFVSLKLFTDRAHAVMVLRTADIAAINIEQRREEAGTMENILRTYREIVWLSQATCTAAA